MRNKLPLVSVLMPVYNGFRFVSKAIESILNQTYPRIEILIADNGSSDETRKILKKYKRRHPRQIRLFHLPQNNGAFSAANFLFLRAKGKYLAPMDSDDVSHPQRIAREVQFLERHPEVILVGSNAKVIDAKGRVTGYKIYPQEHEDIYRAFALVNPIVHPSAMIRRDLLPSRDYLYHTNYGVNSDYYTFFDWLRLGKFANLPEYLLSYRVHGNNSSLLNLKDNFLTVTKIRLEAAKKLHYNLPGYAIPVILLQYLVAMLLPNSVLLPLYLYLRGMRKLNLTTIKKLKFRLRIPALIRYVLYFR